MSSKPYASVILPVHKRSLSLFASLQSVRSQSIDEIEIIVAGDGASDAVVELVEAYARRDRRIRFLKQDKAPGRGERNRDLAVRTAHSDRIFYIDDDDLWLPNHVEKLSPYLDQLDVVNTPIWSVLPSGAVAVLPGNHGAGPFRGLLAQRTLKLVHDTHLAHRKSSYLKLSGGGWVEDAEGRPVLRLLSQFAEDESISWRTIPDMTALSFSSPPRWQYTEVQRLAELMDWLPRTLASQAHETLPTTARLAPFLLEVAFQVTPLDTQDLFEYLARFDIRVLVDRQMRSPASGDAEPTLELTLTAEKFRQAAAVLNLLQGNAREESVLAEVLLDIAESPHGKESMTWHVCNLLTQSLGIDTSIRVAQQVCAHNARRKALRDLLLAQLYFKNNDHQRAIEHLSSARNHCDDFAPEYQTLRGHI